MTIRHLLVCATAILTSGCASLNPLAATQLTTGFAERATEVNDAYLSELNAQILKNILRARDRQGRKYTTLSALKLTPGASSTNSLSAGDVGLGNNGGDPWAVLGGSREVKNESNLELTISPDVKDPNGRSVYRTPISAQQFGYYYNSGWSTDVLEALLVGKLERLVDGGGNAALIARILGASTNFRVYSALGKLTYCFSETDCVARAAPRRPAAGAAAAPALSIDGRRAALTAQTLPADQRDAASLVSLATPDSAFVYCREESANQLFTPPGASAPSNHALYQCSRTVPPSTVCTKKADDGSCAASSALPVSIFLVSRGAPGGARAGVYTVTLNSIDDAIYAVGRSLRQPWPSDTAPTPERCPTGSAVCAESMVQFSRENAVAKLPLFALATRESLDEAHLERCAQAFSASVTHHGQIYFAGPPQSYTPNGANGRSCQFDDRSSTVLTLIGELIELNQVPAELVSTTVFVRD